MKEIANLKNLTSLKLDVFEGINKIDELIQEIAKLEKLNHLNLRGFCVAPEYIKILAESLKNTKIILDNDSNNVFYNCLKEEWDKNGNDDKLKPELTKKLFFKLAKYERDEELQLLIKDSKKYPFNINSKDSRGLTLADFYTNNPEMLKFLNEREKISEKQKDDRLKEQSNDIQFGHQVAINLGHITTNEQERSYSDGMVEIIYLIVASLIRYLYPTSRSQPSEQPQQPPSGSLDSVSSNDISGAISQKLILIRELYNWSCCCSLIRAAGCSCK